MRFNVEANSCAGCVPVCWNWGDSSGVPAEIPLEKLDLVVGSDLVYLDSPNLDLVKALATLLRSPRARVGLHALMVLNERTSGCLADFGAACVDEELVVSEMQLPEEFVNGAL